MINPPTVRICEPPPGIVRLAESLRSRGVDCRILDLCLEGTVQLLEGVSNTDKYSLSSLDTWTRRAVRGVPRNLELLHSRKGYANADRYVRAVNDLQRAMLYGGASVSPGIRPGLANFEDDRYSPLSSEDLVAAGRNFFSSPFFPSYNSIIPEILSGFDCRVVGISLNYLSQAVCTFSLLGYFRELYPEKKLLLGGGLVTSWIRQGIIPGDFNFSGLTDGLLSGRGEAALTEWFGLREEYVPAESPGGEPELPPFDELPLKSYLAPGLVLPWNFTQGCAWRKCTFCPERAEGGGFHSEKPAAGPEKLKRMVSRFTPSLVHLTDNEIPPAFMKELVKTPPGAEWYGFCRFSTALEDPGFCRELAAAGCVMLQLGLESGDQLVLDKLEKGIRVENALRILDNLKNAGIGTYIYLLFGTPAESLGSARKTLEVVKTHIDLMDFFNLAIFNLPVSSSLTSELDTADFYTGDLSLYSEFIHPEGWNRGEVRRFLSGEFLDDPTVREKVNRTPPVFTSSHAPFLL